MNQIFVQTCSNAQHPERSTFLDSVVVIMNTVLFLIALISVLAGKMWGTSRFLHALCLIHYTTFVKLGVLSHLVHVGL